MKPARQDGFVLMTVLGILIIVTIMCGLLGTLASQNARSVQLTCNILRARFIAESGLNKAYNAVKTNAALISGYSLSEPFGGGSYVVTGTGNLSVTNRAQLISRGICGSCTSAVSADLVNRQIVSAMGTTNYNPLAYDILVGGSMTMNGNLHVDVSTIFANGSANLSGSVAVDATTVASAGTATWKSAPPGTTLLSGQPAQTVYPASLQAAVNALIAYAQANGAVYATGADIPDSPPGGVAYCTGPDYGWSGNGNGCFIFGGAFSTAHVSLTAPSGYPGLIVVSPNTVQFNAGTSIYGAVLLPTSTLKVNGHATIYGPLLVGQTMSGNGTADLYEGFGQGFIVPPQQLIIDHVVISAWH